ncbi:MULTISPECIES: cephalosporin hydroxylase family protein [unclassified Aeromonas]|uniref:cephalosporin hydroxylase family protein n=1 Tax=unclassified Aeromonas TaxID=257493 RepID=UPI00084A7B88|nr:MULTISPECIES: cephalosporin hydroxylase family protein [unclassified Aeromonas]OEC54054.1 cephalosporin hydroxylase [Aeromonas sp. ANNP30]OEC64980.1 cephalosporin hydroxylase [Aeromonas sp. ANP5]
MRQDRVFEEQCVDEIRQMAESTSLCELTSRWMSLSCEKKYSYHFRWAGRPIIQYPQDIVAMQEIIFNVKPDLIIETGIAHGGSLIFSAAMLAQLDLFEAIESGSMIDPRHSKRKVIGIDIDIREHNRVQIESHPLSSRIKMLQGSSVDAGIIKKVHEIAAGYKKILLCLDSNHTHDHVLAELEAYADLVSVGSYCVVFDTIVEDLPESLSSDRPWGPGNNPKTAVHSFLAKDNRFVVDEFIENKLMITVAPDGYLKRIK